MSLCRLIGYVFATYCLVSSLSDAALGQNHDPLQQVVQQHEASPATSAADDPVIVSEVSPEELAAIERMRRLMAPIPNRKEDLSFTGMISAAIVDRLGGPLLIWGNWPESFRLFGFRLEHISIGGSIV